LREFKKTIEKDILQSNIIQPIQKYISLRIKSNTNCNQFGVEVSNFTIEYYIKKIQYFTNEYYYNCKSRLTNFTHLMRIQSNILEKKIN
jgi:hypothetical protein